MALSAAPAGPPPERAIIHLDLDCFFAAVAAVGRPELQGKPLAVCHSNSSSGTAEVATCNYVVCVWGGGGSPLSRQYPHALRHQFSYSHPFPCSLLPFLVPFVFSSFFLFPFLGNPTLNPALYPTMCPTLNPALYPTLCPAAFPLFGFTLPSPLPPPLPLLPPPLPLLPPAGAALWRDEGYVHRGGTAAVPRPRGCAVRIPKVPDSLGAGRAWSRNGGFGEAVGGEGRQVSEQVGVCGGGHAARGGGGQQVLAACPPYTGCLPLTAPPPLLCVYVPVPAHPALSGLPHPRSCHKLCGGLVM